MGKIIVVTGTTGIGKTTFVKVLSETGLFSIGLEDHNTRPFQELFSQDKKYAFPNQVDYFLFRAEQEFNLRKSPLPGLIDGGLDLDFHGFSRLFMLRGYFSSGEFDLCKRMYKILRSTMGNPDLIIHLYAKNKIIKKRLESRKRINIANNNDITILEKLIEEWLKNSKELDILKFDVSDVEENYGELVNLLLAELKIRNIF